MKNDTIPFSAEQLQLYLVTDERFLQGRTLTETVEAAVKGGVSMVQLRCKHDSTRDFLDKALALKKMLLPYRIPLLINDRLDIALAADADGVHIGQQDMPFADLKRLLPAGKIIGLSIETEAQALEAEKMDLDYIAASPVFATPTKTDTCTPWGLDGVSRLRSLSRHPLVAIGGIKPGNTADILRAGADGVAIVSGIMGAADPTEAARIYRKEISSIKA